MKRAIIVDSTANIGEELYNHPDIYQADLTVYFEEDKTQYADTWDQDKIEEFYRKMDRSKTLPTSSQPSPQDFINAFEQVVEKGYDSVFVITIAHGISGTFQNASMVAKDYEDKIDIYLIDSKTSSYGMKNMVEHVLKWYEQGVPDEDIKECLDFLVKNTEVYGAFHDLTNFVKGGRIGHLGGAIASALKVAAVFSVLQGYIDVQKVTRGKKRVRAAMDKLIDERIKAQENPFRLAVVHTNVREDAMKKAEELREKYKEIKEIVVDDLTIVLGTHFGEDILAYIIMPYLD